MSVLSSEINWDFIVDKIGEEKCVLVLGPQALQLENGQVLQDELLEYLDINNNPNILKYYADDDFFLFDDAGGNTLICHQIKRFLDRQAPPDILNKIARIPFHLILTVTADQLLPKAFDDLDIQYQFDFYKRQKEPSTITPPSRNMPLIYNMLGCIADEESIVLTYDDLFDYLSSVFARKSMPDKLKIELKSAKNFVFLGVPFDKWYVQLLMRILEINRQQYAFKRYASNQAIPDVVQSLCVEQFKIDFINKGITEFIDKVYNLCDEKQMLRAEGEQYESILDKIKHLIASGNLEKPILLLQNFLQGKNTELYNEVLGIGGRYRRLQRKLRLGSVSPEEESAGLQQITENLLELVDEAKAYEDN